MGTHFLSTLRRDHGAGAWPGSPGPGLPRPAGGSAGLSKAFCQGLKGGQVPPPLPYPPTSGAEQSWAVVLSNLGLVLAGNTAK